MDDYSENIQKALEFIVSKQNSDGGWGYNSGGMSYTEPTAFALLALFHPLGAGNVNPKRERATAVNKGLVWLRANQHSDGGWGVCVGDDISSWMAYPVVWLYNVLLGVPELSSQYAKAEDKEVRSRGRNWILKAREPASSDTGYKQAKRFYNLDADYLGWGWQVGDVGWVIPTALALIALTIEEREVMVDNELIRDGKAFLRDRASLSGGWNAGLPNLLDKPLPALADATAYALLAFAITRSLSDFGKTGIFDRAANLLNDMLTKTKSDHVMALGTLALRFYRDTNDADFTKLYTRLINGASKPENPVSTSTGQDKNNGGWSNSAFTTALALLTLSDNLYWARFLK